MTGTAPETRSVDAAILTPLVRRALHRDDLVVVDWAAADTFGHSLDAVYARAPATIRYSGTAAAADVTLPWTLVLKIVTLPRTPDDPASPDNGEREPLAYRSGLLGTFATLQAPRCFGVTDHADGSVWIWLEEIVDDIGREWPPARYMLAARHLGAFNAAHAGGAAPSYPWLSRPPLREAVRQSAPAVALGLVRVDDNPMLAQAISTQSAAALLTLQRRSESLLDALDRLPQTLCHWDVHRANLFSRSDAGGQVRTVAIDWAGLGWGPLGADMSKILSQTVNFFGLDAAALPALDAALFDHYLDGLRDAGWRGDARDVRLGYTAASALRLILRTASALHLIADERGRASFERAAGQPFAVLARSFAQTLPYYLSLADEAARLS